VVLLHVSSAIVSATYFCRATSVSIKTPFQGKSSAFIDHPNIGIDFSATYRNQMSQEAPEVRQSPHFRRAMISLLLFCYSSHAVPVLCDLSDLESVRQTAAEIIGLGNLYQSIMQDTGISFQFLPFRSSTSAMVWGQGAD
jgi:hypothetical protein